jgi:hypothetical protein
LKIQEVRANNRRKAFEVVTAKGEYYFPYAKLTPKPGSPGNRVREVFPDEEVGNEGFTYRLESGVEDTVHLDAVLEYNQDPELLNKLLLHRLTVEALEAVEESGLSKRELIRALGTSTSQFYRLLDPTYYGKSVGQLAALLHLLGREVDIVVRPVAPVV